jgi:7,8-dihydropterin-6-yl-methyl-4-(beta-D-ribofuranosyl)aminobenzene 5'-phosphate synthase
MKITIVYDNEVYKPGLIANHGFSCLVESGNHSILFDTGMNGKILLDNLEKLGIEPRFDKIVISHNHWDHVGGLEDLLRVCKGVQVYTIGKPIRYDKLIEVKGPQQIAEKVWSTGGLGMFIKEQSLVLKNKNGSIVITGCAHPGLEKILKAASEFGEVYRIIGGFHGFSEFSLLKGLKLICPCHCTVYKREIERLFPKTCTPCGVGREIEI